MGEKVLKYKSGFKYQLCEDYSCVTKIKGYEAKTDYITLEKEGILTIRKGYAWDGCSGPTKDDDTNMTAGLEHDAKYQLMRLGIIPEDCRFIADHEFKQTCKKNGMGWFRLWYYFEGVDHLAAFAAKRGSEQEVRTAP